MKTRFTFFSVLAVLFTAAFAPVDAAKAVDIIKGPYLQQVTQDSIVIMWETDIASDSRVDYGSVDPVVEPGSVIIHEIELTGLTHSSEYNYTVKSTVPPDGPTVTSDPYTFTTAPETGQSFSFVAYGDSRSDPSYFDHPYAHAAHAEVITGITTYSFPDIVIHTGDIVETGDYYEWEPQFFTPAYYLMTNTPMFPVLGNHEGNGSWFFKFFSLPGNEQWFAFTYGGVRFIALDTNVDYSLGSLQYGWLVGELESSASATWRIVYFHHPPYTCTSGHSDDMNVQQDLVPLFEKYGVDMVFNGHSHVYERYFHNGIYYIVTGGGGAPLHSIQPDDRRLFGESTYHHCFIDVGSTSLTLSARHNNGSSFDTITIEKTAKASNPNPEDGAENVALDTVLSWRAGIYAESHDVYFGTTDPPPPIQNQTETIYDPEILTPLAPGITYYWAVNELDEWGDLIAAGDIWSFTTDASLPWSDDFESGSFADGGWTTSGNASVSSKADYSDTYGAEIKGTAWIEKAVSTVGFSNINIKYARKTKGLDGGEFLYVEWYDGSYWHELEATQDTDWMSPQNLTCGADADNNAGFKVRFGTNGSNSAEYAYVDDVKIYESTVVTAPGQASDPSPADGASNVAVTANISWTAGAGAQSHDVYFGNTYPPPFQKNQSGTTFDPGILGNDTLYYWRIDEKNSYDTTDGYPWSFSTQSAGSTVYVSDIAMDIIKGKKYYATATVQIYPTLEGATVVGDWYFKGVLRQAGATGDIDITKGVALITSMTTPAKSGDTFEFVVTDVVLSGYIYYPPDPPDGGSIAVK